jgi:hypothetical protein
VRIKADTNESNTGLCKEVSASKVAIYPLLMLPTLPTMPQPAAINQADNCRVSNGDQVSCVAALAMKRGKSLDFTGYWQRHIAE